jgi:hypothetical protein
VCGGRPAHRRRADGHAGTNPARRKRYLERPCSSSTAEDQPRVRGDYAKLYCRGWDGRSQPHVRGETSATPTTPTSRPDRPRLRGHEKNGRILGLPDERTSLACARTTCRESGRLTPPRNQRACTGQPTEIASASSPSGPAPCAWGRPALVRGLRLQPGTSSAYAGTTTCRSSQTRMTWEQPCVRGYAAARQTDDRTIIGPNPACARTDIPIGMVVVPRLGQLRLGRDD